MKLSLELTVATKPEWVDAVMTDLPSFLQDHADCERKASALAMSLVAKHPDRLEIIPELIATGVEELAQLARPGLYFLYHHLRLFVGHRLGLSIRNGHALDLDLLQ